MHPWDRAALERLRRQPEVGGVPLYDYDEPPPGYEPSKPAYEDKNPRGVYEVEVL